MAWDLSVSFACFGLIVQKQPVVECPKTKTRKRPYFGCGIKVMVVFDWIN